MHWKWHAGILVLVARTEQAQVKNFGWFFVTLCYNQLCDFKRQALVCRPGKRGECKWRKAYIPSITRVRSRAPAANHFPPVRCAKTWRLKSAQNAIRFLLASRSWSIQADALIVSTKDTALNSAGSILRQTAFKAVCFTFRLKWCILFAPLGKKDAKWRNAI